MKKLHRTLRAALALMLMLALLASAFAETAALPPAEDLPLPDSEVEIFQSEEEVEAALAAVDDAVQPPETDSGQIAESAPQLEVKRGSVSVRRFARILAEDTWFYFDMELTQPAVEACVGDSYIILGETDAVLCVEALDLARNSVSVYVSKACAEVWEEVLPAPTAELPTETPAPEEAEEDDIELFSVANIEEASLLAAGAPAGASGSGSFYFTVQGNGQLLIAPVLVRYASGDTILSALSHLNGHKLYDLSDGVIMEVDGVSADYATFTEEGAGTLARPASDVTYVMISDQGMQITDSRLQLIQSMAEYLESGEARANEQATEIYNQLLSGYLALSEEEAQLGADRLNAAMRREAPDSGEEGRPQQADGVYQISTGGELKWFAGLVNGTLENVDQNAAASAVLTADISLSDFIWMPIGSKDTPFAGSFDGQGHAISGLYIDAQGDYQALFGYASADAVIAHFSLSGSVEANGSYVAGVVAAGEASLTDLHNNCSVVATGGYVGGVVGYNPAKAARIEGCTNSGSVYTSAETGSYRGKYIGGVAGYCYATVENCANSGMVSGYGDVGGVAGYTQSAGGCTNTADVFAISGRVGGVFGCASRAKNCVNYGTVTIFGVFKNNRYSSESIGGVIGYGSGENLTNYGKVQYSATGNVITNYVGGIVGQLSGSVSDCTNYGDISACGNGVGGIGSGWLGYIATVTRCVNHGDVINDTASGMGTGGVASYAMVEQCYNTGDVRGFDGVGGVLGISKNVLSKLMGGASASYNLGRVVGNNYVGGVAGSGATLTDCYNVGSVSAGGTDTGPLVGSAYEVENCYYLNTLTLYSRAGTPLDAAGMRSCMLGAEHFLLNFSMEYHGGYPYLDFEGVQNTAEADVVRLPDHVSANYSAVLGSEPEGLPTSVIVTAGGLNFSCAVHWTGEAGYDCNVAGTYVFSPEIDLPQGVSLGENTQIVTLTVTICDEASLPQITAIRLDDGTAPELTTAYNCEPENLPAYAWATVDGVESRIPVAWTRPDDADLTDPETPILYTLKPVQALAFAPGVEAPRITVHVLPLMLVENLRFTEYKVSDSAEFNLAYRGCETVEDTQVFTYDLDIYDCSGLYYSQNGEARRNVYLWLDPNADYIQLNDITLTYTILGEQPNIYSFQLDRDGAITLHSFAASSAKYVSENTLTLEAAAEVNGAALKQKFVVRTRIMPTLGSLSVSAGGAVMLLSPAFDGAWFDYFVLAPAEVQQFTLALTTTQLGDNVRVSVDGQLLQADANGKYALDIPFTEQEKTIAVSLESALNDGTIMSGSYTVRLARPQICKLALHLAPEDAAFVLRNPLIGAIAPNADGTYDLIQGYDYTYVATAYGYVMQQGTISPDQDQLDLTITLQEAKKNETIREDISSDWNNFRGNDDNNAVTDTATPISSEDALLYWANKAGEALGSPVISSPILVDGYLVCTVDTCILKIDTVTGEVVQTGDMVTTSTFNITPPTYADGMIFVALAGMIQAFNADTLESLWVYTDPIGGQPNSPITYRNGYIYTGFWNSETSNANWVCLSITDENPAKATEAKQPVWTYAQRGGFYWAGAYASDKFLLVGTDDGEMGYTGSAAGLLSMDPKTGRVIDYLSGIGADIRCTVCYDKQTNRYYFTSKGGYFYSVAVDSDGYIDHDSLKKLDLRGGRTGSDDKSVEGMSTSTPVIYNGRAYVGVSGVGQFKTYEGHCIAVIDLASWSIAYTCPTKGYPQTSGLLTNAYEKTGKVYIYFFENYSPGTLRIICDSPGQTRLLSIKDGSPISEAEDLFTPRSAQRQFALCSPIVDEYGTIYFKNDSGYMMALGSTISGIEVTELPTRRLYSAGEVFDPQGMKVVAHYANGVDRDITKYVSFSQDPLSEEDTDITIYFRHVKYNNTAEIIDPPQTALNLTVLSQREMTALQETVQAIDALGEITIDKGDAIREARRKYDSLSDALKEQVTNYEILTAAEGQYARLEKEELYKAAQVDNYIQAIEEVTLDSGETLRRAFELYDALSDLGKAHVESYAELLEKQKAYEELLAASDAEAGAVVQMISELGEITLDSGAAILNARAAYDALSEASRAKVTNYSTLVAAEEAYAKRIAASGEQARAVVDLIDAIGTVTLEREETILKARTAYDALDESAKARVTNYEKLTQAEEALAALKRQLEELGAVTEALDALVAEIRAVAETPEQITYDNAAQAAPLVQQVEKLLSEQKEEARQLLISYASTAEQHRNAIEAVAHEIPELSISTEGLAWHQQLVVETLTSSDSDYARFESAVSPDRVIKLYRMRIVDLLTGEIAENHAAVQINWLIPVPRYNASAYSKVGVVHLPEGGNAGYLTSEYADQKRKLAFSTTGDGLIGVAGTKAEMQAGDSKESSGSVLDGVTKKPNSTGTGKTSTIGQNGVMRNYSSTQNSVVSYYGEAIESGKWTYQENVILPELLASFSDAQVELYKNMSEAVENGANSFFGGMTTQLEFDEVEACYRLSNPLSVLVSQFDYRPEESRAQIAYKLAEDDHLKAIDEWHAQIERIVNYCLIQGDVEITAARLYQYLTTYLTAASAVEAAETPAPEATEAPNGEASGETAESVDLYAAFAPSPFYALMKNSVSANDAARAYAYLLMQTGIECMLVQEALPAAAEQTPEPETTAAPEQTPEAAAEQEAQSAQRHEWIVLWIASAYYHADPELDIADALNLDQDRDTLGHFGMSDDACRAALQLQGEVEMVVPAVLYARQYLNGAQRAGETNVQNYAVPACPAGLEGYGMQQTVVTKTEEDGGQQG